jgi:uncharacterized protein (TIGR03435 family)
VKKSLCAIALGLSSFQLHAQNVDSPSFEVASIKRNVSDAPSRGRTEPGGRFTATSAPVLQFIRLAYDNLSTDRILNVPDWVTSERYDLIAKAPDGVSIGRAMGLLMQALLRERFAFEAHFETREMPIYELVLARSDGRLGANLKRAACDCTGNRTEAGCRQRVPLPSIPELDGLSCGQVSSPGRWIVRGYPLQSFLSDLDGRPVVDKTGLTGAWNVEFEFTPDQPPLPGEAPPPLPLPADNAPSFFTALEEQLGLKLRSARGQARVLVIDRIERPTPD